MSSSLMHLSPNEETQILKLERERRRKLRLQQVREQERSFAKRVRQQIKLKKQQEVTRLTHDLQQEWQHEQKEKQEALRAIYERCLGCVGDAHYSADQQPCLATKRAAEESENRAKAEQRGVEAMQRLHQEQDEKWQEEFALVMARKTALEIERARAAVIASQPRVVKESKPPQKEPTKVLHHEGFSTSHYHIPTEYAEKADPDEQEDARRAAQEEEERLVAELNQKKQELKERQVKAALRQKHAQEKELLDKDWQKLLKDLDGLEQADRRRRQHIVSKIPKQIFQNPLRRLEEKEEDQRDLEEAFEKMCMTTSDYAGDLTLALEPKNLPERDQELDLSTDQGDEDHFQVPKDMQQPRTFLKGADGIPSRKDALQKLLGKIQTQQYHLNAQRRLEQSSSAVDEQKRASTIAKQLPVSTSSSSLTSSAVSTITSSELSQHPISSDYSSSLPGSDKPSSPQTSSMVSTLTIETGSLSKVTSDLDMNNGDVLRHPLEEAKKLREISSKRHDKDFSQEQLPDRGFPSLIPDGNEETELCLEHEHQFKQDVFSGKDNEVSHPSGDGSHLLDGGTPITEPHVVSEQFSDSPSSVKSLPVPKATTPTGKVLKTTCDTQPEPKGLSLSEAQSSRPSKLISPSFRAKGKVVLNDVNQGDSNQEEDLALPLQILEEVRRRYPNIYDGLPAGIKSRLLEASPKVHPSEKAVSQGGIQQDQNSPGQSMSIACETGIFPGEEEKGVSSSNQTSSRKTTKSPSKVTSSSLEETHSGSQIHQFQQKLLERHNQNKKALKEAQQDLITRRERLRQLYPSIELPEYSPYSPVSLKGEEDIPLQRVHELQGQSQNYTPGVIDSSLEILSPLEQYDAKELQEARLAPVGRVHSAQGSVIQGKFQESHDNSPDHGPCYNIGKLHTHSSNGYFSPVSPHDSLESLQRSLREHGIKSPTSPPYFKPFPSSIASRNLSQLHQTNVQGMTDPDMNFTKTVMRRKEEKEVSSESGNSEGTQNFNKFPSLFDDISGVESLSGQNTDSDRSILPQKQLDKDIYQRPRAQQISESLPQNVHLDIPFTSPQGGQDGAVRWDVKLHEYGIDNSSHGEGKAVAAREDFLLEKQHQMLLHQRSLLAKQTKEINQRVLEKQKELKRQIEIQRAKRLSGSGISEKSPEASPEVPKRELHITLPRYEMMENSPSSTMQSRSPAEISLQREPQPKVSSTSIPLASLSTDWEGLTHAHYNTADQLMKRYDRLYEPSALEASRDGRTSKSSYISPHQMQKDELHPVEDSDQIASLKTLQMSHPSYSFPLSSSSTQAELPISPAYVCGSSVKMSGPQTEVLRHQDYSPKSSIGVSNSSEISRPLSHGQSSAVRPQTNVSMPLVSGELKSTCRQNSSFEVTRFVSDFSKHQTDVSGSLMSRSPDASRPSSQGVMKRHVQSSRSPKESHPIEFSPSSSTNSYLRVPHATSLAGTIPFTTSDDIKSPKSSLEFRNEIPDCEFFSQPPLSVEDKQNLSKEVEKASITTPSSYCGTHSREGEKFQRQPSELAQILSTVSTTQSDDASVDSVPRTDRSLLEALKNLMVEEAQLFKQKQSKKSDTPTFFPDPFPTGGQVKDLDHEYNLTVDHKPPLKIPNAEIHQSFQMFPSAISKDGGNSRFFVSDESSAEKYRQLDTNGHQIQSGASHNPHQYFADYLQPEHVRGSQLSSAQKYKPPGSSSFAVTGHLQMRQFIAANSRKTSLRKPPPASVARLQALEEGAPHELSTILEVDTPKAEVRGIEKSFLNQSFSQQTVLGSESASAVAGNFAESVKRFSPQKESSNKQTFLESKKATPGFDGGYKRTSEIVSLKTEEISSAGEREEESEKSSDVEDVLEGIGELIQEDHFDRPWEKVIRIERKDTSEKKLVAADPTYSQPMWTGESIASGHQDLVTSKSLSNLSEFSTKIFLNQSKSEGNLSQMSNQSENTTNRLKESLHAIDSETSWGTPAKVFFKTSTSQSEERFFTHEPVLESSLEQLPLNSEDSAELSDQDALKKETFRGFQRKNRGQDQFVERKGRLEATSLSTQRKLSYGGSSSNVEESSLSQGELADETLKEVTPIRDTEDFKRLGMVQGYLSGDARSSLDGSDGDMSLSSGTMTHDDSLPTATKGNTPRHSSNSDVSDLFPYGSAATLRTHTTSGPLQAAMIAGAQIDSMRLSSGSIDSQEGYHSGIPGTGHDFGRVIEGAARDDSSLSTGSLHPEEGRSDHDSTMGAQRVVEGADGSEMSLSSGSLSHKPSISSEPQSSMEPIETGILEEPELTFSTTMDTTMASLPDLPPGQNLIVSDRPPDRDEISLEGGYLPQPATEISSSQNITINSNPSEGTSGILWGTPSNLMVPTSNTSIGHGHVEVGKEDENGPEGNPSDSLLSFLRHEEEVMHSTPMKSSGTPKPSLSQETLSHDQLSMVAPISPNISQNRSAVPEGYGNIEIARTLSLQEALARHKPSFIKSSQARQQEVKVRASEKGQEVTAFSQTIKNWQRSKVMAQKQVLKDSQKVHGKENQKNEPNVALSKPAENRKTVPLRAITAEDRKAAQREIKERTKRLYSQLDEVKKRQVEKERKEAYAANRQKKKEYELKLREQREKRNTKNKKA